ncbi:MAG: hypothetical protein K1X92_01350 [Bacteroidia bacterium]|nr:hypothetical protein [Bacteroidia bacterium]
MKKYILLLLMITGVFGLRAQALDTMRFVSQGVLQTWMALMTDYKTHPQVHLYDYDLCQKHGDYLNRFLHRSITFPEFKKAVRYPEKRQYVPFFVYDLRKIPVTLNGNTYEWAIRVEDYEYPDTPESLADMLAKVLRYTAPELTSITHTKGLVIIAEGNLNNYNYAKLKPLLSKKGVDFFLLSPLIRMYREGEK